MSDSVRPQRWQPTRLPRPWDSPGKNTGVACHFLLQCMKVKSESEVAQVVYLKVTQSCPTPSDPMDCSLPGSSVHGIFQARVLEWGAIAFSSTVYSTKQKSFSSEKPSKVQSRDSGPRLLGFKFQLHSLIAVCPWTTYLTFLRLSFLIWASKIGSRIKCDNARKMLSSESSTHYVLMIPVTPMSLPRGKPY